MLPSFIFKDKELTLLQSGWAAQLNPLLADPTNNGFVLTGVVLSVGDNVINHKLGRKLQGWIVTDQNAGGSIYRSAPKNNLTLTLTSDADVTIDLWVF